MSTTLGALTVVLVALGCAAVLLKEQRRRHHEDTLLRLLALFGPSVARVETEPRELMPWSHVAGCGRTLFPRAFRDLDEANGGRFPFSADLIESVHARWTAGWLAWERDHDIEYKRRATEIEHQLIDVDAGRAATLRVELAGVEQEKLQRYQERYEEHVRIAKAIGALEAAGSPAGTADPD